MAWTNEKTLEFLELYRTQVVIWEPTHRFHKSRSSVAEAWQRIQNSFSLKCSISELKKKKESLMSSYRSHVGKRRQSQQSDAGSDEVYCTAWFAFELMDSFLAPVYDRLSTTTNAECTSMATINPETGSASGNAETLQSNNEEEAIIPRPPVRSLRHSAPTQARKQVDVAIATSKSTANKRSNEVGEVDLFCQLLAKRIKMFEDHVRDSIMWEIDGIVHEHKQRRNATQFLMSSSQ